MKTWTLRFRAVDKKNFEELRSGIKAVETRAATIKYQPIEKGEMNGRFFLSGKRIFHFPVFPSLQFFDRLVKGDVPLAVGI